MPRAHDVGGGPDARAIDRTEHQPADWELLADAVSIALGRKGIRTTDEARRVREDLDPKLYSKLSYYERWIAGVEVSLQERQIISSEEIDQRVMEFEQRWGTG